MANIPVLLLAAGDSSRMGSPKQLLAWGNQSLIEYQIKTLMNIRQPVCVVLGSNANQIIPFIKKFKVKIFINEEWMDGIGNSIATGVKSLTKEFPEIDGVLIALLDQPLIPPAHFRNMLKAFQPGKRQIIVSESVSGWKGVPVLFDKYYFSELRKLKGPDGAKKIIQKHKPAVKYVECGNQLEDMDTPEAYQKLLDRFFNKIRRLG